MRVTRVLLLGALAQPSESSLIATELQCARLCVCRDDCPPRNDHASKPIIDKPDDDVDAYEAKEDIKARAKFICQKTRRIYDEKHNLKEGFRKPREPNSFLELLGDGDEDDRACGPCTTHAETRRRRTPRERPPSAHLNGEVKASDFARSVMDKTPREEREENMSPGDPRRQESRKKRLHDLMDEIQSICARLTYPHIDDNDREANTIAIADKNCRKCAEDTVLASLLEEEEVDHSDSHPADLPRCHCEEQHMVLVPPPTPYEAGDKPPEAINARDAKDAMKRDRSEETEKEYQDSTKDPSMRGIPTEKDCGGRENCVLAKNRGMKDDDATLSLSEIRVAGDYAGTLRHSVMAHE